MIDPVNRWMEKYMDTRLFAAMHQLIRDENRLRLTKCPAMSSAKVIRKCGYKDFLTNREIKEYDHDVVLVGMDYLWPVAVKLQDIPLFCCLFASDGIHYDPYHLDENGQRISSHRWTTNDGPYCYKLSYIMPPMNREALRRKFDVPEHVEECWREYDHALKWHREHAVDIEK